MAKPQTTSTTPANGPAAKKSGTQNNMKEWDEGRVQNALARVQDLHAQLRQLRTTVPSLLAPIHAEHNSPETLFAEFSTAATVAVDNLRDFQSKMRDPKTREILEHAKESKEQTSEGIKSWLVSQNEDWLDQPALRSANDLQSDEAKVKQEDEAVAPKERLTIPQAVQKFKSDHKEATVNLQEDRRNITIHLPSPAKLNFNVTWEASATPTAFKATAKGSSAMLTQMNSFLAKRPRSDDLPWTLETLHAYSDIRARKCDKCNRILSAGPKEHCSKRYGSPSSSPSGSPTTVWKAYHPNCEP